MTNGDEAEREVETKSHASAELLAAMGDLLAAIRDVDLPFDTDGADAARRIRDEVTDQLSDYILPRLVQFDAPLLMVIGGSTGAGKSTLVNSIVGDRVTQAGVLRPTTRAPVLVHHPDDIEWFSSGRVLPDMLRSDDDDAPDYGLRLVATDLVPAGVALLDAPDVDSIDTTNRGLATQLLAAADMWLFVTSAARYADQVPWDYLRRAADRSTSLAVVLDRTAEDAMAEVRSHLARMMTARGLSDSPLFAISESKLDAQGLLPQQTVAPIARWLKDLAGNPAARRMVVGRTLDGAVRHIVLRTHDVADALDEQHEVASAVADPVLAAFDEAAAATRSAFTDESLVQGDLLARWRSISATPTLKSVAEGTTLGEVSDIQDEVADATSVLLSTVAGHISQARQNAADSVSSQWSQGPAGRSILEHHLGAVSHDEDDSSAPDRPSDARGRADGAAKKWVAHIRERLKERLVKSDSEAVIVPDTVDLLTLAAAIVSLGGSRPTDDSVVVANTLLERALGEPHSRAIIDDARAELENHASEILEQERSVLLALTTTPDDIAEQQTALRQAARAAEVARHSDFINGEIAP